MSIDTTCKKEYDTNIEHEHELVNKIRGTAQTKKSAVQKTAYFFKKLRARALKTKKFKNKKIKERKGEQKHGR